jgi:hypothetical protein
VEPRVGYQQPQVVVVDMAVFVAVLVFHLVDREYQLALLDCFMHQQVQDIHRPLAV